MYLPRTPPEETGGTWRDLGITFLVGFLSSLVLVWTWRQRWGCPILSVRWPPPVLTHWKVYYFVKVSWSPPTDLFFGQVPLTSSYYYPSKDRRIQVYLTDNNQFFSFSILEVIQVPVHRTLGKIDFLVYLFWPPIVGLLDDQNGNPSKLFRP